MPACTPNVNQCWLSVQIHLLQVSPNFQLWLGLPDHQTRETSFSRAFEQPLTLSHEANHEGSRLVFFTVSIECSFISCCLVSVIYPYIRIRRVFVYDHFIVLLVAWWWRTSLWQVIPFTSISTSSLAHLDLAGEWSAISCPPRFKLLVHCVTLLLFVGRGLNMCKGLDDSLGWYLGACVTAGFTVRTLPFCEGEHGVLFGKGIEWQSLGKLSPTISTSSSTFLHL